VALQRFVDDRDYLLKKLQRARVVEGRDWMTLSPQVKGSLIAAEPVVAALNEEFCTPLAILHQHGITTSCNMYNANADLKQRRCDAGLPQPMLEDLIEGVRKGMMLPTFKYAYVARFLKETRETGRHGEAATIYDKAVDLGRAWYLDERGRQTLCELYQVLLDLTQKYFLLRYSTATFLYAESARAFPKTRELKDLHNAIVRYCGDLAPNQCSLDAIAPITYCSENTKYKLKRIPCSPFSSITDLHIDPYWLALMTTTQSVPPVRPELDTRWRMIPTVIGQQFAPSGAAQEQGQ
jgi:hypothetical protein